MSNNEMLDIFVDEVVTIKKELTHYLSEMMKSKIDCVDRSYFEKYGQAIDRIYGTAATMGHPEIAQYCKAMKDVTYMASASDNMQGHKKVIRMMIECTQILEEMTKWIYDKDQVKLHKNKLIAEVKRAQRLNQQEFYSVDKKSCA
jgi:chemotaxis protein histidine kinase CheA